MVHEARYIGPSDLQESAAWERVLDEIRMTRSAAVIRAAGEDIAELRPAPLKRTDEELKDRAAKEIRRLR